MGTKANPGQFDCFAKALDDEPMFTLLARDTTAPAIIRAWAYNRERLIAEGERPEEDMAMVIEALGCASQMEIWRKENDGKWREEKADAGGE